MRPKSLALLAGVVLGLAAFLWFVDRDLPSSDERAKQAKRVLDFEEDDVDALTVHAEGASAPIELVLEEKKSAVEDGKKESEKSEKSDTAEQPPSASRWQLVAPLAASADDAAVGRLLQALHDLEKKRTLDDMPRQDAGLEPPRASVTLGRGKKTTTLEIGAELPDAKTMLVGVGDEAGPVYVVADTLLGQLVGDVDKWRNRKLFPAQRDDIESVRLTKGSKVVLLTFGKDGAWLEVPLHDRAEESLTNQLLQELVGLEAKSFLDAEPSAVGAAAGGLVEVKLEGRDEPLRIELGEGSAGAAEESGSSTSAVGEAVDARVDGLSVRLTGLADAMNRDAQDWRSHQVLSLPVYRIDGVAIDGAAAAGSPAVNSLELSRQEGDWLRGEDRISFSTINDLLYALSDLRAVSFAQSDALDERQPVLGFTFTETATDGGGATHELRFFSSSGKELAMVSGRPDALVLDPGTIASLRTKVDAVRDAEPLAAQPAEKATDDENGGGGEKN